MSESTQVGLGWEPKNKGLPETSLGYRVLAAADRATLMNPAKAAEALATMKLKRGEESLFILAAKLKERLDGLVKDPNWKGNNDAMDPKSQYSLDNIKRTVTNEVNEHSYSFDKDGRFLGWASGTPGRVATPTLPGVMDGGIDVHNHPSRADRPLGLPFSDGDFISYSQSKVALGVVFAREGEYRMELPKGGVVINKQLLSVYRTQVQAAFRFAESEFIKQGGGSPEKLARLQHTLIQERCIATCAAMGIKYSFKPNPGFEELAPGAKFVADKGPMPAFTMKNTKKGPHTLPREGEPAPRKARTATRKPKASPEPRQTPATPGKYSNPY